MSKKTKVKNVKVKVTKRERALIFLIIFFVLGFAVASFYSTYFLNRYTNMLQESIESRMSYIAEDASLLVKSENIKKYADKIDAARAAHVNDEAEFKKEMVAELRKPEFQAIIADLRDFAEKNNVIYVYVMRIIDDKNSPDYGRQNVIFDSDPDQDYTCDPEKNLSLWYYENPDDLTTAAWNGETKTTKFGKYTPGYEGIMATYSPIRDASSNIIATVGVDISDTEIVDLRLRSNIITIVLIFVVSAIVIIGLIGIIQYRKKATDEARSNLAKSQFLARMSHEIRTPMNAVIGFCRMASNSDDIERIKVYLSNIGDSSKFLLQLINNILDISKIEAGKMSLRLSSTPFSVICQNVRSMLSTQAEAKRQNFTLTYDEAIPPYLMCDSTYLMQIIVNLVGNAIKFTQEEGNISLDAKLIDIRDGRAEVRITVTDNGIGIDPADIGNLFNPFEQGDNNISRQHGGTGLGLAVSKMLAEMMGGRITVESKLGAGSTFTFTCAFGISSIGPAIPTVGGAKEVFKKEIPEPAKPESTAEEKVDKPIEDEQQEAVATEGESREIDFKNLRFLVAEDNEINQLIAADALKEFGSEVDFADNGQIALEMYMEAPNKYDIIFMDLQMPVMDGYESTRRIRLSPTARAKSIPIIAMTADTLREDVDSALKEGMNIHIGKPFDVMQLADAIYAVLKG